MGTNRRGWLSAIGLSTLLACVLLRQDLQGEQNLVGNGNRKLFGTEFATQVNVLTFGGSVSWGAGLENRDLAYPGLLKNESIVLRSDNLAIRASSAVWPATCLQTLVNEKASKETEYQVGLVEFSVNGIQGLQLLLQRLRARYPRMLIIYIDLYSNRRPGYSNCLGPECRMNPPKQGALKEIVTANGGLMVSLPRPRDPKHYDDILRFFGSDHHHLSAFGHAWVAQEVLRVMRSHQSSLTVAVKQKGTWLGGDWCSNWFESGSVSPYVHLEGGTMNQFATTKHAYEIRKPATMRLSVQPNVPTPLLLVYMSKGNPSLYPFLRAKLNYEQAMVIDPTNRRFADDHVTGTHVVGILPRSTSEHVVEMTNLDPAKDLPFRLVGIILCVACVELNYDLTKRCRQRGCVHSVDD